MSTASFRRDGIPEIVSGFLWLLWGLAFLVPAVLPNWSWTGLGGWVLPVLMLLGAFAVGPITRALKRRIAPAAPPSSTAGTDPDTDTTAVSRVFTFLFSATLLAALVWVLLPGSTYDWLRLIPVVLGMLLAAVHAFIAWRHQLRRYRLLALYILAAGAVLSSAALPPALAFSLFLIVLGAGSAVAGYAALRSRP